MTEMLPSTYTPAIPSVSNYQPFERNRNIDFMIAWEQKETTSQFFSDCMHFPVTTTSFHRFVCIDFYATILLGSICLVFKCLFSNETYLSDMPKLTLPFPTNLNHSVYVNTKFCRSVLNDLGWRTGKVTQSDIKKT